MKRPRWAQLYEELQRQRETIEHLQTANKHLHSELALVRLQTMQQEVVLRGKLGVTEEEFTVALSEILRGKPKEEPSNSESTPACDASRPSSESETAGSGSVEEPMPSEALSNP
jgi:hypothetical protein